MEIVWFVLNHALSIVLGFFGGLAYHQYRLWRIKRHAPSAKIVSFHVTLTQQDYDRQSKYEDDVMYNTLLSSDDSPMPQQRDERQGADSES